MIKFLELTAPEVSAYRQAKIVSIECREGDKVREGTTLFRVKSGEKEIDLPATREGKVFEIIASVGESITISSALILLETITEGSTATPPIIPVEEQSYYRVPFSATQPPVRPKPPQRHLEKPKLRPTVTQTKKPAEKTPKAESVDATPEPSSGNNNKPEASEFKLAQEPMTLNSEASKSDQEAQPKIESSKKNRVKKHEQQSLNLDGEREQTDTKQTAPEVSPAPGKATSSAIEPQKPDAEMSTKMPASSKTQITVPDIGTDSAKVIEILVQVGDTVAIEDPLVTLESDKASMDVPSSHAGVVSAIVVSVEDDVSEGSVIVELSDADGQAQPTEKEAEPAHSDNEEDSPEPVLTQTVPLQELSADVIEVVIPDIGGDSAKVIEILVKVGDTVEVEDALVTLESDKASMDVPSSAAGTIEAIKVNIDDDVSEGTVVVTLSGTTSKPDAVPAKTLPAAPAPETKVTTHAKSEAPVAKPAPTIDTAISSDSKSHASPSIRRFARELGVDLAKVNGSGRKGRITKEDVASFVKDIMTSSTAPVATPAPTGGSGIPPIPAQDFSKFGETDIQPLNKIKRLTAANLHRSWVNVPHVTHNDESNISDLESFRKQLNSEYAKQKSDIKLSPLAFIVKAVVNAMQMYPQFNSSLEPGGENLIYKKYFHIGIAVETPNGLVVPVVKNADKKSVAEIAREMGELAKKARDKKLTMADMSGACMTISSLGGIGGTHFTPIVNAPEVAILGVSRSKIQPVWNGSEFEPGTILPLSLSYDHRVIDGAEAARFTRHIAAVLEDVRRLTV